MGEDIVVPDMITPNESPQESKGYKKAHIIVTLVIGLLLGSIISIGFVQLEISPQWVTDQTLKNQSQQYFTNGFNQGVIQSANYTTLTANFSYIHENKIVNQNIFEYCNQLNQEGGNK